MVRPINILLTGHQTMTASRDVSLLAARVLLGALFIVAGLGKLADVQGFAGYMASGGVPSFLAWPVILLEILGGLAILAGFQTRVTALVLAAFTMSTPAWAAPSPPPELPYHHERPLPHRGRPFLSRRACPKSPA